MQMLFNSTHALIYGRDVLSFIADAFTFGTSSHPDLSGAPSARVFNMWDFAATASTLQLGGIIFKKTTTGAVVETQVYSAGTTSIKLVQSTATYVTMNGWDFMGAGSTTLRGSTYAMLKPSGSSTSANNVYLGSNSAVLGDMTFSANSLTSLSGNTLTFNSNSFNVSSNVTISQNTAASAVRAYGGRIQLKDWLVASPFGALNYTIPTYIHYNVSKNVTINVSTLVPTNFTFNRTVNMTINQSVNQTFNFTINVTVNTSVNNSHNRTINYTVVEYINKTVNRTFNESVNRTLNYTYNVTVNKTILVAVNKTVNVTSNLSINNTYNNTVNRTYNLTVNSTYNLTVNRTNATNLTNATDGSSYVSINTYQETVPAINQETVPTDTPEEVQVSVTENVPVTQETVVTEYVPVNVSEEVQMIGQQIVTEVVQVVREVNITEAVDVIIFQNVTDIIPAIIQVTELQNTSEVRLVQVPINISVIESYQQELLVPSWYLTNITVDDPKVRVEYAAPDGQAGMQDLVFAKNGAERFRIDSNGNFMSSTCLAYSCSSAPGRVLRSLPSVKRMSRRLDETEFRVQKAADALADIRAKIASIQAKVKKES
eukprot:GILI01006340.1.p1 GENE.GILI01006340.1~~GILI01006340.1.p1  ORF type:complete len:680 (+),score=188.66 GILI01006340.1:245-2041(+)